MKEPKQNIESVLKQVALSHGVSVESVKSEIENALECARANEDPEVQAKWASIPKKGAVPTTEEVLLYLAQAVKKESK